MGPGPTRSLQEIVGLKHRQKQARCLEIMKIMMIIMHRIGRQGEGSSTYTYNAQYQDGLHIYSMLKLLPNMRN
jgi:hypothetical protein